MTVIVDQSYPRASNLGPYSANSYWYQPGTTPTPTPTPTPSSTISGFEILGAAVLPDGADAAIPNGWVAKITLPDDGASTFDPTKITVTTLDPGYDTSGNTTTVSRTIKCGKIIRKQYPNQAQVLNSASGGVRTVYVSLEDDIYQGTTVQSVAAAAGYYGGATAGAVSGVLNSSTIVYEKPHFTWMSAQHERVNAATYQVEGMASHRRARASQQVACIKYYAVDGQGTPNQSATVTASSTSLTTLQTQGTICETYKATISLSALTQGDLCLVNAQIYPWMGDSGAVLNLFTDGLGTTGAWQNGNPQTPLRFLNDKTGAYGGAVAIVKPSGTATGTTGVATSYGGLGTTLASAYSTIQGAIAALLSYNNTNKGHNNHSGSTVYLGEDVVSTGATHTIGASSSSAAGLCLTDIVKDPGALGVIKASLSATAAQSSLLRWKVNIDVTGNFTMNGGSGTTGNTVVMFADNTINYTVTSPTPINTGFGLGECKNVTFTGDSNIPTPFYGFSTNRNMMRAIGVISTDQAAPVAGTVKYLYPYTIVGCVFSNWVPSDAVKGTNGVNNDPLEGAFMYNNRHYKMQQASLVGGVDYLKGFTNLQCLYERSNTASTAACGYANDSTTSTVSNATEMYTTVPGVGTSGANIGRRNQWYADVVGAVGIQKRANTSYILAYDFNNKTDTFTTNTTATGRTGNWRYRHQVGNQGIVIILGGDDGSTVPGSDSWLGDYYPASSKPAGAAVTFTNNASGTAGAGGGDYTLTGGSNDAYNRVPSGMAGLRYDLAGISRKNDGTGAAGAYERTV